MNLKFLLLPFALTCVACATDVTRHDFQAIPARVSPSICLRVVGDVPAWFANRLLIRVAEQLPPKTVFLTRDADLEYTLTLEPFSEDYTPIYCVFPTLVSFFGCPQGTVTRDFTLRLTSRGEPRIHTVWQGRVRRPFGLYYVIPSVRDRIMDTIIEELGSRLGASLVQAPGLQDKRDAGGQADR